MLVFVVSSLLPASSAFAQAYPPAFPRDGSTKILENARVVVWDATWHKGRGTPIHEHPFDYLSVTLAEGTVKVTEPGGKSNVGAPAPFGLVRFNPRGVVHAEEGVSDPGRRAIMVELKNAELKNAAGSAVSTPGGTAGMFPREGAAKLRENERVVVWDFTWKPGQRTSFFGQPRDAVVVFLTGGTVRWTSGGRVLSDSTAVAGSVVYLPAGQGARADEALEGQPRAIVIELK
jgi:quercetin dioxygenase-like cupin family protein